MRWESNDLKKGAMTLLLVLAAAGCGVEPAMPATAIAFTAGPTSTTAGAAIAPGIQVTFYDAVGNLATSATTPVTLSIANNAGEGTLSGVSTATPQNGIATFSTASIDKAGSDYTLTATAGTLTATSTGFSVSAATPATLTVVAAPTSVETGTTLSPVVKVGVLDAFGNATAATTPITLAATAGTPTLLGTTTVNAVGGVATFTNLRFQGFGTISLDATATGLTHVVSSPIGVTLTFASISADTSHTCGLSISGAAFCWGAQFGGELGDGTFTTRTVPTPVSGGLLFSMIDLGMAHTCAIGATDLLVYCWGYNNSGQVGDGTTTTRLAPTALPGRFYATMTAGPFHACALLSSGPTQCWGANGNAMLGDSTTTERSLPVKPAGPQLTFSKLTSARYHTCGLRTNSTYCWGNDDVGQVGDGGFSGNRTYPTLVSGGLIFSEIAAGGSQSGGGGFTCALTAAGTAWCWGGNVHGQVGDGTTTTRRQPTQVIGGISFTKISAGPTQACGLTSAGAIYCWGLNTAGQAILTPTRVGSTSLTYTAVSVGYTYLCAIAAAGPAQPIDGQAYCWGANPDGRLGIGSQIAAVNPTAIIQR
jgi:alpha-tubulin suppressor-like RCC1 family protein